MREIIWLSRTQIHDWSESDLRFFEANYGHVPIERVCNALGLTVHQVHSKASRLGLTRRSICGTCGKDFVGPGNRKLFYCSKVCRRKSLTKQHDRYVSLHRDHIADYTRAWKKNWGASSPEIALKAERIAIESILPKLGFSEVYHASVVKRFIPFDLIATYGGRRVLIDVTTGISKWVRGTFQDSLADALRMPFYVLFIKPDFSTYQLRRCEDSKSIHMHVSELVPIE